ncbi:transcriptional regulator, Crp/Fnr family [Noviherbaspirillum humi]|uniref:Transcriptional regulator, Crp/Fnr family n=2 Tax=Noviherbaspirillum humi TaxID=1688639 RepID=A0A239FEP7_9BURK|nr:helix-turn-helix domain-containing protein [Noviherbaspirillum humi]SNS55500.1 transcriptional regulator, Crp/Fnr family [Noviherbaspirillum humi]
MLAHLSDNASPSIIAGTNARVGFDAQRNGKLWSNLKEICELLQLPAFASAADEEVLFQHVQFKAGQRIHTIGQPFDMLYIVNSGFLKTALIDEAGNEHVLGFPMRGDLFGMDGIHSKYHTCEAAALTSCDIILVPFKTLAALGRKHAELEIAIFSAMSRELVREQAMVSMLGSLSSEARVARFLVNLSDRFARMGYSGKQFNLRMTRQEIGSYLGLTLETVSRTFSAFNKIGLIAIDQRAVEIRDLHALKTLRRLPPSIGRPKAARPTQPSAEAA